MIIFHFKESEQMREKRSLFDMIFGKQKQAPITASYLQMLNGFNPTFTNYTGNLYESKVARQCIDRIATYCAKLIPKHIKGSINNEVNLTINQLLQNRPNPLMNTYDFIYKIISMLYTDSNAFVFIQKDKQGYITGFYPIIATQYELFQNESNEVYLQFDFINGQTYYIPYLQLIHLRLFYNKGDIFGTNSNVLKTDIQTSVTASEGIANAIKTSNNLKGILRFTNSMLKEKDIKASKDAFVRDYLNLENTSGIASLDAKAEFQEVNIKPITLDKAQLEQVNNNVYDYFGISEKIIRNDFTDNEWNAFYEGVIEPRAMQLSYEFTNKIFSNVAIQEGNKIVFTANRLQYQSLDKKKQILEIALPYGLLTKDMALEVLDLPPIGGEEGKKIIQSLNNIDSSIANDYQGGE
jgi:HK97 family phage portal protein